LPNYLPWTESDLTGIERALKRYRTAGLEAACDFSRLDDGIVSLSQVDLGRPDASIVVFEVHKLARADSAQRAHWVVQLMSIGGPEQAQQTHGCVFANALVFALAKAEQDLQQGFAATANFDLAANAYWLK
jgi:hypothetical protein